MNPDLAGPFGSAILWIATQSNYKMKMKNLIHSISRCEICAPKLDHKPRPVVQISQTSRILIAGQAPGRKVHESGIPFDDASGDRLRDWMGISRETFYDADKIAILPMGFCYPGQGKSGDFPPRSECAAHWRQQVMQSMPNIQLTLVIGIYAMNWHMGKHKKDSLTETVKAWKDYSPLLIPLPHPSPRNNIWLSKNPWFAQHVLPELRTIIGRLI